MRRFLLASVALIAIGMSAAASAADIGVYKAPPPPPVYSWTGCYIGAFGGSLWLQKDYTLTASTATVGVTLPAALGSHNASNGIGGLQEGCNYQFAGGWVVGIQGDYGWTNAKGSHLDPIQGTSTLSSNTKSLGSVTGRIGYAWNRFLGYVKGGGAWERDDYGWAVNAGGTFAFTGSETRNGWTVGVGGEYAFLDWLTGFVEYDYYNFGTHNVSLQGSVVGAFNTASFDIRERKSVVKAGLNFKFGGGPVVARY